MFGCWFHYSSQGFTTMLHHQSFLVPNLPFLRTFTSTEQHFIVRRLCLSMTMVKSGSITARSWFLQQVHQVQSGFFCISSYYLTNTGKVTFKTAQRTTNPSL